MKKVAKVLVASAFIATGLNSVASESAGYVEPGYLNYNYEITSNELSIKDINTLNRLQPSAAGDRGILEPGYLNYRYEASPATNPSEDFNQETLRPFYSNYQ